MPGLSACQFYHLGFMPPGSSRRRGRYPPFRRNKMICILCLLRFLLFQSETYTMHPVFAKADKLTGDSVTSCRSTRHSC